MCIGDADANADAVEYIFMYFYAYVHSLMKPGNFGGRKRQFAYSLSVV